MLVYITNRKLPDTPVASREKIAVKKISQKLNSSVTGGAGRIITGLASADHKNITFYPRGEESKLFDSIAADELKKPWLVFLHGFHQDPEETVEKARLLQEIHGVNVVLFAWPSHPLPIKSFEMAKIRKQIKIYLQSMIFSFVRPNLVTILVGEIRNFIRDYTNNYRPARKNAEKSTDDFYAALSLVDQYLAPKVGVKRLSLVVHSMGNYLLQRTLYDKNGLPTTFSNIVSHEADVKASNHASWITGLFGYSVNKVYITVNAYDSTLAGSNILHRYYKEKDTTRLGQSTRLKPEGIQQGYIQKLVHYLDFTDGEGIDGEHEIFTRNSEQIDPNIVALLGRVFRGEADKLPAKKGRSASGFSMMPTVPMVYKPQWIVEDESLCDDGPGADCLVKSLDEFDDPFAAAPEYIPELDDD
jgi:DNA-binding transcriptional MerR regulator